MRLRGVLRGPAGRVTPAGTTAAAALYWVTATTGVRPRGSRSVQCFERLLEGVSLELSSGERVPLARWATVWDPSTELYEPRSTAQAQQFRQSSVVLLARTRDQTAVPAGVAAGCTSTQGTSHLYSERTAAEGSLIEISGCFRRGQLEPCEDGADAWCGSGDCEEFVRSNLRASR